MGSGASFASRICDILLVDIGRQRVKSTVLQWPIRTSQSHLATKVIQ